MDPEGAYCVGCFRTLEEIAGWSGFDDARRRLVWEQLRQRRAGSRYADAVLTRRSDDPTSSNGDADGAC
jgi:predicted Fe-S protein YdhL (DUF1289 family)